MLGGPAGAKVSWANVARCLSTSTCIYFLIKIYVVLKFIFVCAGSSLPRSGFLWLWRVGATPWLQSVGFSLRWLLLLQSTGSRAPSQWLCCVGFVAPWHRVGHKLATEQQQQCGILVPRPGIERWQVDHWTISEVLIYTSVEHQLHTGPPDHLAPAINTIGWV